MSEEHVDLYQRAVRAWNEDDLETWVSTLSPNWEFRLTGTFPGFRPIYRGPDGAAEFWETLREPWEEFRVEVEAVRDMGDRVVGLLRFHGRGKASGVETALEYAHIAAYTDRQNTHLVGYTSHVEALEAAGLSE